MNGLGYSIPHYELRAIQLVDLICFPAVVIFAGKYRARRVCRAPSEIRPEVTGRQEELARLPGNWPESHSYHTPSSFLSACHLHAWVPVQRTVVAEREVLLSNGVLLALAQKSRIMLHQTRLVTRHCCRLRRCFVLAFHRQGYRFRTGARQEGHWKRSVAGSARLQA